mmetsp:Transcript_13258/g.22609  ORF Transcript_13258/g.22609 Transcript_13258/m.22609 type:complete len:85 (+) Transcript_13258:1-255(+)
MGLDSTNVPMFCAASFNWLHPLPWTWASVSRNRMQFFEFFVFLVGDIFYLNLGMSCWICVCVEGIITMIFMAMTCADIVNTTFF